MQKHKLLEEISIVDRFQMLALVYEEIAVLEMQKIRGSVLKTREFIEELSRVFYDVKNSYKKQILALAKKKKKRLQKQDAIHFSTLSKNGKQVIVLLSANTKLYGDIVPKTFQSFLESLADNPDSDIVIVGKLGKELFDQSSKKPYSFFALPDIQVTLEDLKPIVSHIVQYETVTVYYGKFVNVIEQIASHAIISGEQPLVSQTKPREDFRFIFEPELEKILNYFETQIFSALFKQTVHEYQLARHASRIRAMEYALGNIARTKNSLESQNRKLKHAAANKKMLAAFSGIALWGIRR